MNDKFDFVTPSTSGIMTSPSVEYLVAGSDAAAHLQRSPLGGQMNTHNYAPPSHQPRGATNTLINNRGDDNVLDKDLIYTNNNVNNNYDVTSVKPQQPIHLRDLLEPDSDANLTPQSQQLNENTDEELFISNWFQPQQPTTSHQPPAPQQQPQQPQQPIYTNLTPVVDNHQAMATPQPDRINIYNVNTMTPQQVEYTDQSAAAYSTGANYQPPQQHQQQQQQQQQYQGYEYAASPQSSSNYNQGLIPVVGYNNQQPQQQQRMHPQHQPQQPQSVVFDTTRAARGKSARKKPRYPAKGTSEYVEHRRKNNEAVRRSRAKQKMKQLQQTKELESLKRENNYYRCQLNFEQHHRNNNNPNM